MREDIQPQMIEAINRRMQHEGLTNVRTVLGTPTDPRLPSGLDAVLIVDAYREMDDPQSPKQILTFLKNVAESLKPQGRLGVVDFLPGGGGPGPAPRIASTRRRSSAPLNAPDSHSGARSRSAVSVLLVFGKVRVGRSLTADPHACLLPS